MLSVQDARKLLIEAVSPMPPRKVKLPEARGCVLAEDVVAETSLPGWDNSAVDGYAVRSSDLAACSENSPIHLRVTATLPAGSAGGVTVEPQSCARIFTGAPIPPGADAVLMQEDTRPHHEGYIAAVASVSPGENIRRAGEEAPAGAVVLRSGTTLGAAQLGMAAAVGRMELTAHGRPRVAVLVTGQEVVEPGRPLQAGQVYDSNSFMLAALLRDCGCEPVELGIADDVREDLLEKMDYGLSEADALVTVGGASVGEYDLVKDVLAELGCEQRFWKVAMKPGKPFVFGTRGAKLVFGLPGNPVSAVVTFLVLVRPALMKLRGFGRIDPAPVMAEAAADLVNARGDRTHFMRARLERDGQRLLVRPLSRQGSHMISTLTEADCLVEVPACQVIAAGSRVPVMLLEEFAGF